MAQVIDRTVGANPTGFDMRTELNNIIGALESDNSGSSEPLNTVAYMKWLDTSNATYYYYKERNHNNTAWVTLFRYTVATKIMEVVSNGVVLQDSALVHKTGDETIAGVKTFTSSPIVPNATTETQPIAYGQAVKNTGYETIAGVKTFSSSPIVPTPTIGTQAVNKDYVDSRAGATFVSNDSRVKTALNATGNASIYACRAWVNFNGTGTIAIRASGNVSSITDNGVGYYTANFISAMPDINFCTSASCTPNTAVIEGIQTLQDQNTINSVTVFTRNRYTSTFYDAAYIDIAIFR